jgi:hypothetical protein
MVNGCNLNYCDVQNVCCVMTRKCERNYRAMIAIIEHPAAFYSHESITKFVTMLYLTLGKVS